MRAVEAPCPACGAAVEFKTRTGLVTICPHCQSAVARGDRQVEDIGKVAALVPTESAVFLGQTGQYGSRRFEVLGHVQYQHPAGGVWEEWYLSFPGERWLWLAEAQGKLYLTQERKLAKTAVLPAFDSVSAGQHLVLGRYGPQTVAEVNQGVARAAEGEIPFRFVPGAAHRFVDLVGPHHRFSTIDYSDAAPRVFVGREATLEELGLSAAGAPDSQPLEIQGLQLACPQCGGALELRVPDQSQRVTCPFCSSLLDVEQGNLKCLTSLGTKKVRPHLAIGSEGILAGIRYTVVGFVRRAVRFDQEYTWDEYLLYTPQVGFRWLVHSDCHWSFVEPVSAWDVRARSGEVVYDHRHFRRIQRAWAEVKYVLGEMYWKLKIGEIVLAEDFIAPPQMISIERTPAPGQGPAGRINADNEWQDAKFSEEIYSLGTYVPHADVEQGFGVSNLPRGWAIAPNQPRPETKSVYQSWVVFSAALILIDVVLAFTLKHRVDHWLCFWAIVLVSLFPLFTWLHARSFEHRRWADSQFNPYAAS